jgi:hypothetical protein
MPALPELQRRFGAALTVGDDAAIVPFVHAAGIDPARRIAIYRNNWRENFLATLAATYPVIKRLVGDAYFRQLARDFQALHPSQCGNLQQLGAPLAAYLRQRFAGTEYAYFADVARLEWAYQEVLTAAEQGPLDVGSLRLVPDACWPQLRFSLHPAARLVRSEFPVLRIWSAHQPGADGAAIDRTVISLDAGGDCLLLHRTSSHVEMRRLARAEFALLERLAGGESLAAAASHACTCDAEFDLTQALLRNVSLGVLADFSPSATPEPVSGA